MNDKKEWKSITVPLNQELWAAIIENRWLMANQIAEHRALKAKHDESFQRFMAKVLHG